MRFELLHQHFEAQVDRNPNATAVVFGDQAKTYQELDARANGIAHALIQHGVGVGHKAALLLPRSIDAYAGLLGILKAGAAYVPIDKDYPDERIEYILENCGASAVVSLSGSDSRLGSFAGSKIFVDKEEVIVATLERPVCRATSSDVCYAIYTSGSTGKPKGVEITHRNATFLITAEAQMFGVKRDDCVYQGASLCFDLSVEEVWLAFNSGAKLIAATPEVAHGGPELGTYLSKNRVTVLSCVPTLLRTFTDELPDIRILIFGGEKCPPPIVAKWSREGRRLVNTYGPTEATVIATFADVTPDRPVTIGKAVPGYHVYLLNDELESIAHGEVGEICVGGEAVAKGYIGLAEATARVFVRNPFHDGMLYRTGDLGRYDAEGNIEFLGRKDGQVKIRGFRVELGEIETQLQEIDGVHLAACVVKENEAGVQQLIAYVELRAMNSLGVGELLKPLRTQLPSYMVPNHVEIIAKMPKLASGKIDYKSLPAITTTQGTQIKAEDLPKTANEKMIANMWQKLFGVGAFSRDDDFFLDLGGQSLLAAQFVSDLRLQPYCSRVSLMDLYDNPTVANLAGFVDRLASEQVSTVSKQAGSRRQARDFVAEKKRHFWAGAVQLPLLYLIYAFQATQWVTPYLVFYTLVRHESPVLSALAWSVLSFVLMYPTILSLVAGMKWLVLGRVKAGEYPLWGTYYVRWWFIQRLFSSVNLSYLHGTPLMSLYLRLLGAKIGKNVHLSTDNLRAFDLVSIGDGSCMDEDASLRGASVKDGMLVIAPVTLGSNCYVGTWSTLKEDVVMENNSRLDNQSLLTAGSRVREHETWAGSPAHKVSRPKNFATAAKSKSRWARAGISLAYALVVLLLPVLLYLPLSPGIAIFLWLDPLHYPLQFAFALPFVGACFVFLMALETVLVKWLLVGKVQPGSYPLHGWFYFRHWIVERMMSLSLEVIGPLHSTLYLPPWYRALGSKIGKYVELSTATSVSPDLLAIGEGGTVADEASLGAPRIENGKIHLQKTILGKRAFVGNSAVIPCGTELGDGSLVGVLSLAPADASIKNATWLGSPSRLLPHRQGNNVGIKANTYVPSRKLFAARAFVEFFRITLPPAGFMLITSCMIIVAEIMLKSMGLAQMLLVLPLAYMACCLAIGLIGVAMKWLVIGVFKPFEKPLWSFFVWRFEFVNALYEFLTSPLLLDALLGTPYISWYMRLLGVKIGKALYTATTGFLEFDLTEVGDFVALNENSVLQTHLFEDRVFKSSRLRISDACSLGSSSVVLYDSKLGEGVTLDSLSLVMKGESLPAHSHWAGIPARSGQISEWSAVEIAPELPLTPAPAPITTMGNATV